jgi:hypothetical protein
LGDGEGEFSRRGAEGGGRFLSSWCLCVLREAGVRNPFVTSYGCGRCLGGVAGRDRLVPSSAWDFPFEALRLGGFAFVVCAGTERRKKPPSHEAAKGRKSASREAAKAGSPGTKAVCFLCAPASLREISSWLGDGEGKSSRRGAEGGGRFLSSWCLCVLREAGVRNPFAKGAGRRIAGGRVSCCWCLSWLRKAVAG